MNFFNDNNIWHIHLKPAAAIAFLGAAFAALIPSQFGVLVYKDLTSEMTWNHFCGKLTLCLFFIV